MNNFSAHLVFAFFLIVGAFSTFNLAKAITHLSIQYECEKHGYFDSYGEKYLCRKA